jgi:hypothetical protein
VPFAFHQQARRRPAISLQDYHVQSGCRGVSALDPSSARSPWRSIGGRLAALGNELFNYAPAPLLENLRWLIFMDHFETQTWLYAQGMLALLGLFSLFLLPATQAAVR